MLETFKSFELMQQAYWALAVIASVIFVIQGIMTFSGMDADTDTVDGDADFDADGFHLVSFKTIVCFALGFGWTGALLWDDFESRIALAIIAMIVGFAFMSLIAYLLYLVLKLDRDNTFKVEKVIGLNADVYLVIPADRTQSGKIMVSYEGSMHELEAVTADGEQIPTGAKVTITGIEAGEVVIVSKI